MEPFKYFQHKTNILVHVRTSKLCTIYIGK